MVLEEIVTFLKQVPPFQFLDAAALNRVALKVSVEYYPKGTLILQQDGPPSTHLMVIKKGGVKVGLLSADGEEIVLDYRSEGDVFGFLSLVSADRSRTSITAVEDSIVYQVERGVILKLLESNPAFTEYYVKSFLNKIVDKTFAEMHSQSLLCGGGDKLLFTTPVGELASKDVVTALGGASIREAAQLMTARGISSLIVVDESGAPTGILTDRDLREKVVAGGRAVSDPIREIMSVSIMQVEAGNLCFEALLTMIRHNIHHLVVVEGGKLKGVVTNHDLMLLQGTSPLSLARDIESQQTVEGVVPAAGKIGGMITLLLKEGAHASNITRVVTEINDRLVRKIVQIAERTVGRPPLPFCWIVFGSEGRKEQTFKTDQDNAIVHADPQGPQEEAQAREYFPRLAAFVNEALVRCGFPECPGNYMARNPEWCQPLAIWKGYFSGWINEPTEEAILRSVILFDFRPVAGDEALAGELKAHLLGAVADKGIFLKQLAALTTSLRPPLGFFKNFVVLKSGEHKDQLDLKVRCITPLINIVRLYALEAAIPETSTLERLAALRETNRTVKEHADELEQAFEFFLLLRIHHQFDQIEQGRPPDNFINPSDLTNLQKKIFRDSCQVIGTVLDSIFRQFNPGMRL
jgi:CBS domain-containing protein